jgi:hypothetical protein
MIGGAVNAVLSGSGLTMPVIKVVEGSSIVLPGILGNVLVGAVAAFVSFGLYGQFAAMPLFADATKPPPGGTNALQPNLTLAAITGAVLVGFSGGRWISAEADKQLNHAAIDATAQAAIHAVEKANTKVGSHPNANTDAFKELLKEVKSGLPNAVFDKADALRKQSTGGLVNPP